MRDFLLLYTLAPDYLTRRAGHRGSHLTLAQAAVARGELLLGGAFDAPADQAVQLFAGDDASAAEAFARADPYVTAGLVSRWAVRPWVTVVGAGAPQPVAPDA